MALKLKGSTSGFVAIDAPSVAGNNTLILPENTGSAQQLLGNDITAGVVTFTSVTVNRNGDLTVPGTISIGGTLTYEDVTSVDSVGIVTARSGVRINGGGLTIIGDTTGLKTSGISTLGGDVSITGVTTISYTGTSQYGLDVYNPTSGSSGARVRAGDNDSQYAFLVENGAGTNLFEVLAGGGGARLRSGDLFVLDKISHYGETDTHIRFPANDTISLETAGNERVRITSGGKLLVGHTAAHSVGGGDSLIQVQATDSTGRISVVQHRNEADGSPFISLGKSRGTSKGSTTILQSGDEIGTLTWVGADGNDLDNQACCITGVVDGTPGSDDMPGRLEFRTTADGSASATTRLTINQGGNAQFTGIVTATQFAATTISNSRKNLLINGEMQVDQRMGSPSLSYYNPVTSSIYTLDRWKVMNGSSFDTDSAHIHKSTLSPDGFSSSMKWEIGNTETPSSSQNCGIEQKIEGRDLQHLAYGTSSAKTMTLSFHVYSNKTGTYCVHIMQEDGTKYQMHEYTISSSNTWEKKTIRIVGNTANAINDDSTTGLRIIWVLTVGSGDTVAATSTWASGGDLAGTSNQVNLWDNGSNEWYLTGCQLELGDVATAYEHRSFADELATCQRYYYKAMANNYKPQQDIPSSESIISDGYLGWVFFNSTNARSPYFMHPVEMRATPSVTVYSTGRASGDNKLAYYNQSAWVITDTTAATADSFRLAFKGTTSASMTAGYTYLMGGSFACESEL